MNLELISQAFADRSKLEAARPHILAAIEALDRGQVRVAEKVEGEWRVHTPLKEAILLYFSLVPMETWSLPPFEFRDKIPLKSDLAAQGVRAVPPGLARYGSYLAPGVVLMGGYVNLGAYVGAETMVDSWAIVGSCAQIGARVHLSAQVTIGGVLEPAGARPVIIEDDCFIGANSVIVEGVVVEEGSIIGAGTTITASTHIIDVTGPQPVEYRGRVPARSIVIPGSRPRPFPSGTYQVPCALIIGQRQPGHDSKTSLNQALRHIGE